MKKHWAILLAPFTAWPPVAMIVYMAAFFWEVISMDLLEPDPSHHGIGFLPFEALIFVHLTTMILVMILLMVYIPHLFLTDRVAQDKKALWAVVLFLGNIFAMPVYWYLYLWRDPGQPQSPTPIAGQSG